MILEEIRAKAFRERPVKDVVTTILRRFSGDDSGAVAVEYVVIAVAMATAIIPATQFLNVWTSGSFQTLLSYFDNL
jgi:Flp pilus assembly pilin Flp